MVTPTARVRQGNVVRELGQSWRPRTNHVRQQPCAYRLLPHQIRGEIGRPIQEKIVSCRTANDGV
jgi:hypothetical protein